MYDSSAVKVASKDVSIKDKDTLIEQSLILIVIEQSSVYSKPQFPTLTCSDRITMSIIKAKNIYMLNFIHNNSISELQKS